MPNGLQIGPDHKLRIKAGALVIGAANCCCGSNPPGDCDQCTGCTDCDTITVSATLPCPGGGTYSANYVFGREGPQYCTWDIGPGTNASTGILCAKALGSSSGEYGPTTAGVVYVFLDINGPAPCCRAKWRAPLVDGSCPGSGGWVLSSDYTNPVSSCYGPILGGVSCGGAMAPP